MMLLAIVLVCVLSKEVQAKLPNMVFILTDDQDSEMGGQTPMAKTMNIIGNQGIIYENMFVSSPLCCPSRSSILSGQYVHNHGALNNSLAGGCSNATWQQRQEPLAFPTFLKKAGYNTLFAGKYLNQYGAPEVGGVFHVPPGWDWWYGLVGNSKYYNYNVSINGTMEMHGDDPLDYFTYRINSMAQEFLRYQNKWGNPIFMMLSTPACHAPFTPEDKYNQSFPDVQVPRHGSFNVTPTNKHWLIEQTIVPLPEDTVTQIDDIYRNRWRTLLSVDDMVSDVYNQLRSLEMLDNTYFFISSDNGYHLGQFGLPMDKRQLYDFDIRVPLMISGPGIAGRQISKENVMNIDLAPTFLELANQTVPPSMDGRSLMATWSGEGRPFRQRVLVEHQGEVKQTLPKCPQYTGQGMTACSASMGCVCEDSWNNTYSCVRVGSPAKYKYCVVQEERDFIEVYELLSDPFELHNINAEAELGVLQSLQEDLEEMRSCSGHHCSPRGY